MQRLRLFLLLSILVVLVAGISVDVWTRRQLDRELARVEQRYGSLRVRTLVAPPVGAEYNSARFVRAAAALTVRPSASSYGMAMAAIKDLEKLPEPSIVPRDLQAFVDANTEAMRLVGEAIDRHQASWDADYAGAVTCRAGWTFGHSPTRSRFPRFSTGRPAATTRHRGTRLLASRWRLRSVTSRR